MSTLELDDIQADVAVTYPGWGITYRFFKLQRRGRMVADPGIAATVLDGLAHSVTRSGRVRPETTWTLTVGFTAAGLEAIGVSTDTMTTLPDAFVDGMYRRADKLGDDTSSWDDDFKNNHIDIVAVLRYTSEDTKKEADTALADVLSEKFATQKFHLDAQLVDSNGRPTQDPDTGGYEHFGFRDGISNPVVEGAPIAMTPGNGVLDFKPTFLWSWRMKPWRWRPIRAGEFLLGYPDEMGEMATIPHNAHLIRNGTYLVVRKLEQDVAEFKSYYGSADDDGAARAVGRKCDGTPLCPITTAKGDNGFLLKTDGCDVASSHIRRMNPRNTMDMADLVVRRHRIIRRSMPYTPTDESGSRGLIFSCYQADIGRQFEFVQTQWLNSGRRLPPGASHDVFSAAANSATVDPTDSVKTGGESDKHLASFVTSRGGEYFLVPGIAGLSWLADVASKEQK
jgi:Dyp-type peroxidase family